MLVWSKQRKGRGLRSGQPCDWGCSLGAEVRCRALSQSLPAPARAQSPMEGGGGGSLACLGSGGGVPDNGGGWTPQDSQPPIPHRGTCAVPALPHPHRSHCPCLCFNLLLPVEVLQLLHLGHVLSDGDLGPPSVQGA